MKVKLKVGSRVGMSTSARHYMIEQENMFNEIRAKERERTAKEIFAKINELAKGEEIMISKEIGKVAVWDFSWDDFQELKKEFLKEGKES